MKNYITTNSKSSRLVLPKTDSTSTIGETDHKKLKVRVTNKTNTNTTSDDKSPTYSNENSIIKSKRRIF